MKNILICVITAYTVIAAGCGHRGHPTGQMPPRKLRIMQVVVDTLPTPMSFTGQLSSNYEAIIQPRVSGYLTSKNYSKGMPVKKGQLIYTIDPAQLNTQLAAAEAALNSAKAQAVAARNDYERAVPLARIEAISQSQLDRYTAQYRSAEASVKSAEEQVRNARLQSGYSRIYAPIDGIIGNTAASVGDYVGAGTQYAVLATIENIDTVTVDLSMPTSEYLAVQGAAAQPSYDNRSLLSNIHLTTSDGVRYPYSGVYSYTRQNIGAQTGTIVLVVGFPNPEHILKSGLYARVTADVGTPQPRMLVPQSCVVQSQNLNGVWVMRPDSTLTYRAVELGQTVDTMWIVESGLSAGEYVILDGLQRAHNGERIVPSKIE